MTDEQIIKALEAHTSQNCGDCPYDTNLTDMCVSPVMKDALDLIKRQQEEIDLLKMDNEKMTTKVFEMAMKKVITEKTRAEAIKEFAEKLEHKLANNADISHAGWYSVIADMQELGKEMGCGE